MSILNLLLREKIILITLGLAFLPFAIALTHSLVQRERHAHARRTVRRKLARALNQQMERQREQKRAGTIQAVADTAENPEAGETGSDEALSSTTRPETDHPGHPQDQITKSESEDPSQFEATADEDEPQHAQDTVSSAMQALLAGVFGDDEAEGHYATLLKDAEPIDVNELADLANTVSEQLHAAIHVG